MCSANRLALSTLLAAGLTGSANDTSPATPQVVRTPRLIRAGSPDTHSMETLIASIVRPGMSQQEKAMAVYDFLRTHIYHWGAAREHPNRGSYEYGVVYDPVKLVNVYGYGYCFQNNAAAEALWQAAGLEARSAGIGGHTIAEVFYDGQYHFLDIDQHGYCLLPDGRTIASIDQIARDPIALILNQPNPSRPFFPAGRYPRVPYESRVLLAAHFASRADNHYRHDKIVTGHRMDITLLPGMRYERRFASDGRWNIDNDGSAFEYKIGYHDPRIGPKDFLSDTGYANGDLFYQPDLTTRSAEYAAGVCEEANIEVTAEGLVPAVPGQPAWCVFRIRLPYVIVGWPTSFQGDAAVRGAAVVSARFQGEGEGQGMDVSVDNGATWTPVWTNLSGGASHARVDLSDFVAFRYEYRVRVRLASESTRNARLESLAIRTGFQLAPRALPALQPGDNPFSFFLGDQSEMLEIVPDLAKKEDFFRHVKSSNNIRLRDGRLTSQHGRPGEAIFELRPPRPGTVAGFSVEAGCRRAPYRLTPDDDIKIHYARNEPENWTLVYDDEFPAYARHWSYHANAAADCPPGTKAVFVKIALRTAPSASIQHLRLRLRWNPADGGGMPKRGLRVEHGWSESGAPKKYSTILTTAPAEYTVRAGEGLVNRYVTLEPVRAEGLVWRDDDPALAPPPMPEHRAPNEALRDEMRALLRGIDADPATWLPKAAASEIEWLARSAQQALAMYATNYPIVSPEAVAPSINPFLDETRRNAAEKILAGVDGYAKIKLIENFRASGARELPAGIVKALSDPWRHVRLAALQAARSAGDLRAAEALKTMARDDPETWLRAEAESVLKSMGHP